MTANIKDRKPWLAALLSIATIGLGHVYAGKLEKGVLFYIISFLLGFVCTFALIHLSFPFSFILFFFILSAIFIIVVKDSYNEAKEAPKPYIAKGYNKWYFYVIIYVVSSLVLVPITRALIRNNVVQAYKIPSGAMLPTIQIGDCVLVDKRHYNSDEIKRGDIIVFKYPEDQTRDFIKRVIGLPGETIEIKNQVVYIDGKRLKEDYVNQADEYMSNMSLRRILPDSYFVMGDNRGNSMDSRVWGFLNKSLIIGKVYLIYWSSYKKEIRWERIGKSL
jgi:signal peptidase I